MTVTVITYDLNVGRWQPGARERLVDAAFELFAEQEFADVTGKRIAERAGLTERTFFRHFADKRDVLFTDAESLHETIAQRIAAADEGLSALLLVREALTELGDLVQGDERHVRLREELVASLPELRERERTKHAVIEQALTQALAARGTDLGTATLAAAVGVTCFGVARDRWLTNGMDHPLLDYFDQVLGELTSMGVAG